MLPLPMRLFPTAYGVGWEAEDKGQIAAFLARRGSSCDSGGGGTDAGSLPCAKIATVDELRIQPDEE